MLVAEPPLRTRGALLLRYVVSLGADSLRRERCDWSYNLVKYVMLPLIRTAEKNRARAYLETACKCQTVTREGVRVGFANVLVRSLAGSASAACVTLVESLALFLLTLWSCWYLWMWTFMQLQVLRLQRVVRPVWLKVGRSQDMEEPHGQIESERLLFFLLFAFGHNCTATLRPGNRCILHQSTFPKRISQQVGISQRVRRACRVD